MWRRTLQIGEGLRFQWTSCDAFKPASLVMLVANGIIFE